MSNWVYKPRFACTSVMQRLATSETVQVLKAIAAAKRQNTTVAPVRRQPHQMTIPTYLHAPRREMPVQARTEPEKDASETIAEMFKSLSDEVDS